MFGLVWKRDYDVVVNQYEAVVEKHNKVSTRHNDLVDKNETLLLRQIELERDLARESTLRERLELDKAVLDSDYRRLIDTLGTLAKRPGLDTFTSTDLFAEDTKQETVWVSDPNLTSEQIFAQMQTEPVTENG